MDEFLDDFKARMRIFYSSEDIYLKEVLNASFEDIQSLIGAFDPSEFASGKELVFERARYVYNDSLEYFYDNFQQRILDLSIVLLGGDDDDEPQL